MPDVHQATAVSPMDGRLTAIGRRLCQDRPAMSTGDGHGRINRARSDASGQPAARYAHEV
jgi:hypothetical protein